MKSDITQLHFASRHPSATHWRRVLTDVLPPALSTLPPPAEHRRLCRKSSSVQKERGFEFCWFFRRAWEGKDSASAPTQPYLCLDGFRTCFRAPWKQQAASLCFSGLNTARQTPSKPTGTPERATSQSCPLCLGLAGLHSRPTASAGAAAGHTRAKGTLQASSGQGLDPHGRS